MSRLPLVSLALPFLTSCLVVPEGAQPEIGASATLASEYNFRGMTNVEAAVLQTDMVVDLPTKVETGQLSLRAFANWDLENDVGDAWFPDGHAGEPSQIDLHLAYSETYRGTDFTSGIVSYVLQNPDDFPKAPDGERGETKEVFFHASRAVWWELVPSLALHYDFDEVEDFYGNAGVSRSFPLDEKLVADARVSLGWAGEDQSEWLYGLEESGFADLQARAGLAYLLDAHTTLRLELAGSSIVDEELRDWFDLIDVDSETIWASLGVSWAY